LLSKLFGTQTSFIGLPLLGAAATARLSDSSAVITYECSAKRKNGQPYHALVSSGYAKRADGWKLAFHHQTPLQS
jgi:hypothetical protein